MPPHLLAAPKETDELGEGGALILSPASLQVTLTSLDIPFAMFAPKNLELEDADPMGNPPDSPETTSPLQGGLHSDGSSGGSSGHTQDDFVMIDFKPAFSKDDILPMDLGTFYREFQNQPQLSSLSLDIGAQSMADDLVRKPLGHRLTLWPPVLLPWPFLLRRPGEFFPLLPHAHTSHLGGQSQDKMVEPLPSCDRTRDLHCAPQSLS